MHHVRGLYRYARYSPTSSLNMPLLLRVFGDAPGSFIGVVELVHRKMRLLFFIAAVTGTAIITPTLGWCVIHIDIIK